MDGIPATFDLIVISSWNKGKITSCWISHNSTGQQKFSLVRAHFKHDLNTSAATFKAVYRAHLLSVWFRWHYMYLHWSYGANWSWNAMVVSKNGTNQLLRLPKKKLNEFIEDFKPFLIKMTPANPWSKSHKYTEDTPDSKYLQRTQISHECKVFWGSCALA